MLANERLDVDKEEETDSNTGLVTTHLLVAFHDKSIQDQPVLDTRQIANIIIGEERQLEEKVEIRIDPGGFGTL